MFRILGLLGDTRKQAAEAYFMYVEDASEDARSKDPKCGTSDRDETSCKTLLVWWPYLWYCARILIDTKSTPVLRA